MTRAPLFCATLCLAAACGGGATEPIVTEPVRHAELELTRAGADLDQDAVAYVGARVGLDDGDELAVLSVRVGPDGLRHARLRQVHRGVPVHGTEIVAHADATTFLGYAGRFTRNLGGLDLTPALDSDAALATARAARSDAAITYDLERATLEIWPRGPAGADLVWHVELSNRRQAGAAAAEWHIVLDAATGDVLRRYDALHTVEQASGPGGNDKVSWTWNGELDVEEDGGEYVMETDRLRTLDGSNNDEVVRGPLDNMEDKAANDAHGYGEATLDMMSAWAGQSSLDGNGFLIVSRVHDTTACGPDNACWYLQQMHYGDGAAGGAFYPFSGGIDVVGHELNHGFTEFHSALEYSEQAGGLNESFSDVAGTMVEFYREGERADFLVGEDITTGAEPLRTMCEPARDAAFWQEHKDYWISQGVTEEQLEDFVSIDHASKFEPGMNPHWTSGPPNKAFCLTVGRLKAETAGTTTDAVHRAGQAWYAANAGYWTSASTYDEACQGIVDAGRALGFSDQELTEIAQSWADVGVTCDAGTGGGGGGGGACDGDGTCDVTDGETCGSCGDCGACPATCGPFQMAKCAQGIGDCSACGAVGCGDGVCAEGEDDVSCAQDCGCTAADSCGSVAPWGCWCDAGCGDSGDCCADVAVCGG